MKQIIYTISLVLLLGACTDEKYDSRPSPEGGKPGELVPVKLALNTQPVQSPLSSGTKAEGTAVRSAQIGKGVEISLEETPVTRSYEDEIKNFQVFQFDGITPESKLVRKDFINSNSVENVLLSNSFGVKNRIIVIANAGETTFDNMVEDSSTLADFDNKGISYTGGAFPSNYPLLNVGAGGTITFTGSTDMVVATNKQADVMLYRSVARVKVKLSLSADMQNKGYTAWTYQFMKVPKKSFYHSIGRTADFPGKSVGYADYATQQVSFPGSIDLYLPVNLQQSVPFTSPDRRVLNAPAGATYLQIMGMKMTGSVISRSVLYQIHLGSNFTDDYSISPNYSYTYNIRITGESDDDSRVIKFVPGYFSGALKTYTDSGGETTNPSRTFIWRYEKRFEVYIMDVNGSGGIQWQQSGTMPALNDLMDGRKNTWSLKDNTGYAALQKCIGLNGGTPLTMDGLEWYMPSYGQALSIYVAGSSTLKTLPDTYYWTSTANATYAWGIQVRTGANTLQNPATRYNLRCIKDLSSTSTIAN